MSRAAEGKELKAQNCSVSDTDTKVNAHTVPTLVDTGTTASNFSLRVRVNDVIASCLVDTGAAALDAAVAATLELESYLHKPGLTIASLDDTPDGGDVIAAASKPSSASIQTSLQKLLERMDKLEVKLGATKEYNPGRGHQPSRGRDEDRGRSRNKKKLVCWKCKQEGHFARNCTTTSADQGNAKPLGQ